MLGRWLGAALLLTLAAGAGVVWYLVDARRSGGNDTSGPATVVFVGDSYTQGTGASRPESRWTTLVSEAMGWREVNLGRGGTGYLADGDRGCGREYCPSYLQMLPQVLAADPDVVVVSGGLNDRPFTGEPRLEAQVASLYATLTAALPSSRVIAVGPSAPGRISDSLRAIDELVHAMADDYGVQYVNLLDPNPITPAMVLPDGAHVGDDGHAAIAERVVGTLSSTGADTAAD